ncbi:MAG: serine/threonine protein kinase [Deltaproteobacteria bacterium]|nr:serine/threonine protein kinase [Deltaproteobacteria bacterium]
MLDGRFEVEALLGVGGMAAVYAAKERGGARVALKVLHSDVSSNAEVRKRFLRESYVANSVEHPGVVRVHDHVLGEDDTVYLVMDLLDGKTLEAFREEQGGKLPAAWATRIVLDVLDVLGAAHSKRIVHRDIKPDNVFLTVEGTTKLMDFGVARMMDAVRLTASAALMGTPAFMSPEQASSRNKEISPASDVWSVAAVLFLLLTGEEVHPSRSGPEQIIFAATQTARKIATVMPELPEPLCSVVDVGLEFEPQNRFQSATAMARALEHVMGVCGFMDGAQTRPVPVRAQSTPETLPGRGEGPVVSGAKTMIHGSASEIPPRRGPPR